MIDMLQLLPDGEHMTNNPPPTDPETPPIPTPRRVIMIGVIGMTVMLVIALIAVVAAKATFEKRRPAAAVPAAVTTPAQGAPMQDGAAGKK
jgi:uncharacterized membrane protein YfbV (UPF0208 family)